MNLTFSMALDYRHDNKAAALVAAGMCNCQAVGLASWQWSGAPVRPIKMQSAIP
jgi:hypothetical protein